MNNLDIASAQPIDAFDSVVQGLHELHEAKVALHGLAPGKSFLNTLNRYHRALRAVLVLASEMHEAPGRAEADAVRIAGENAASLERVRVVAFLDANPGLRSAVAARLLESGVHRRW